MWEKEKMLVTYGHYMFSKIDKTEEKELLYIKQTLSRKKKKDFVDTLK